MELTQTQIDEIAAKLGSQLAAATAQAPPVHPAGFAPAVIQPMAAPAGFGVGPMATPSMLLLRVKIPVQSGEAGGYLGFQLPEGATVQTVQALAAQAEMTWQIETYRPRDNRGWGNNGGGYGNSGYRNNRRY
ncbi:MAG: hypothetical protein IID41_00485 [Planctomycetes bacterium]|nr:hypothetical protein [Planctomycetota bacterium]